MLHTLVSDYNQCLKSNYFHHYHSLRLARTPIWVGMPTNNGSRYRMAWMCASCNDVKLKGDEKVAEIYTVVKYHGS